MTFVKGDERINRKGRPKGTKSLKTFAMEMLKELNDDEKKEYLKELPKDIVWKMAEGNPKTETDVTLNDVTPSDKQKELSDKAIGDYLNK